MTDEEMAVNWIRSQGWSEENLPSDEFRQMFQAFLAGLKVGRPKWHSVADGDLPKKEDLEMQVLCFTHDGYQLLSLFSDPKPIFKHYEVVAWCEIQKYTEE